MRSRLTQLVRSKGTCKLSGSGVNAICPVLSVADYCENARDKLCMCSGTITNFSCSTSWQPSPHLTNLCSNITMLGEDSLKVLLGSIVITVALVALLVVCMRNRQRMGQLKESIQATHDEHMKQPASARPGLTDTKVLISLNDDEQLQAVG